MRYAARMWKFQVEKPGDFEHLGSVPHLELVSELELEAALAPLLELMLLPTRLQELLEAFQHTMVEIPCSILNLLRQIQLSKYPKSLYLMSLMIQTEHL